MSEQSPETVTESTPPVAVPQDPSTLGQDAASTESGAQEVVGEVQADVATDKPDVVSAVKADEVVASEVGQQAVQVLKSVGHTDESAVNLIKELWKRGLALVKHDN